MSRWTSCSGAILLLICRQIALADGPDSSNTAMADQPVASFQLKDFHGKACALDDFREQPLVVLAFLGVDCPLAKLYGPRLEELAAEYQS